MKMNPKKILVESLWFALGRKNLVRLSRLLSRAARLDGENHMQLNGEMMVIDTAMRYCERSSGGPLIVDCGANVGEYSVAAGKAAMKNGMTNLAIHAFEPASSTFQALWQNLSASLPNISVSASRMALSDAEGEVELHIVHDKAGVNSLVQSDLGPITQVEKVPVSTLTNYCVARDIQSILLLKIDTEGNDYNVLIGAEKLIKSGAIELVQFEYNHRWIFARRFLRDVFGFLNGSELRLGKVTSKGIEFYRSWHPELETFAEGNYLICKPEWVSRFQQVDWWGHGVVNKLPTNHV